MKALFVDTAGWVACADASDPSHARCCDARDRALEAGQTLERAGFAEVYHVVPGFEGELDDKRHRGTTSGWRFAGLPWEQG